MEFYKILHKNVYSLDEYSLVPIRKEDRYDIMKWRNEQIYHLRQTKLLTKEEQDEYFDTVIARLYNSRTQTSYYFLICKEINV